MVQAREQFSVMGLPVHLMDNYCNWLSERLKQGLGSHVVTLNAEMTMQAKENPALATVIRQAELVIPDGAGIVFYLWLHGIKARRCPGIELSESLLWKASKIFFDSSHHFSSNLEKDTCSIFFYGGAPGVAQTAAEIWQKRVPKLNIVGTQHGYISAEEEKQLCQKLQQLQPRLILVGLGVPRQELWIAKNRHLCPQATWIGVGGSFDIWAGKKQRAPVWMQKLNIEWLYRLYQEPWRWRRMLVLPKFAWQALFSQKG
ncbi:MAG: WecB/TagA/CpsF family glycosyltransferase [Oscillatoriaceae bacterium SKW80]|nr:WecB/TagA/CpsF family glycosyltransferase [Oscillatoriaceae bacterium SKYG93]MCX8119600.1 WecB/TagA/CpsF family glycosyltransferase [Oscillatoriaceae bacterium SKW80]MDW8455067.1 WecB/TagA/CpsF family glycosyltransferase [Oscillatoriaceae cyanobacterium SKYGB_i_bin93]HIK28156.1 WecB/TagA/CpsF family glycosyltransferase [Oscillatoriaceae cyanobacterium M7585_C2015_266]